MPFGHQTQRCCTAHSKRDGRPCRQPAMRGKTVCKMHGGKSKSGMAHGNYKHGRYSKVLPVRLQRSYEQATNNPQLLSVRHDLAACEALLVEAFGRLDTGESGQVWSDLREALTAFEKAEVRRDPDAMDEQLATIRTLIRRGHGEADVIEDIRALWDSRCKLTLTEQKTLVALHQMMTKEQLLFYIGAVTDALTRHVTAHTDEPTRAAILGAFIAELEQVVQRGDSEPA